MTSENTIPQWLGPVTRAMEDNGRTGVFLVAFPEYRPDLVKALAHHLDLEYFDFRAEVMARLGSDATTLESGAVERSLAAHATQRGVAVINVEALLAAKPAAEREAWLRGVSSLSVPHPVLIALTVFAHEANVEDPRFAQLQAEELPDQSFLSRLAN